MTAKSQFKQYVIRTSDPWISRQVVRLGNLSGTVQTGTPGVYFARQYNDDVIRVHNALALPPLFDRRVEVGEHRQAPGQWQIIRGLEDYGNTPANGGQVGYHHEQHEERGGDRLALDRKQIVQLSVRVKSAAEWIVRLFGGIQRTANGVVRIDTQNIDLSSYVVTTGAKFVAIETDDDGVVSVNEGTPFAAPGAATVADMPAPALGKYTRAWVLLFGGQVLDDTHIIVPMPPDYQPVPEAPSALDDLTDVNAPAPTLGQVLTYDGAEWIADDPTGVAGDGVVYEDLSSQVDGVVDHFDLGTESTDNGMLFYGGVYQPQDLYELDVDGLGLTLDFVPVLGETLIFIHGADGLFSPTLDFIGLGDVPSDYTGHGGKVVAVKSDVTGLEFIEPSAGGRTLIDSQTPTGTGTVSFTSIPGTYKKLVIEYVARGTQAAASVTMRVQLNGDTTAANYRRMLLVAFGASTVAGGGADDGVIDDSVIAASGPANNASYGVIEFPFYAGTTFHKQVLGRSAKRVDTATNHQLTEVSTLNWENAGAITQIDLVLSAGNFASGSIINLYGEN